MQKTLQKHLSLQHEDNMEGLSTYMNYPRLAYSRRQLPMASDDKRWIAYPLSKVKAIGECFIRLLFMNYYTELFVTIS